MRAYSSDNFLRPPLITSKSDTIEEQKAEFVETILEYMDNLYQRALQLTGNKEDAEDLVQETYLRAYRFWDKFIKGTNAGAWLFTILKRTYLNNLRLRRKQRDANIPLDKVKGIIMADSPPPDLFIEEGFSSNIRKVLDEMPGEFREAILLRFVRGYSYREIAEIMGCPIGTVESRIYRGRKLLRQGL